VVVGVDSIPACDFAGPRGGLPRRSRIKPPRRPAAFADFLGLIPLRARDNFLSQIKVIWAVQSGRQKY
jgi:hypothetical protein